MHDYKDRPAMYDRKVNGRVKRKIDWFLWISTGIALFMIVNAANVAMNSW